MPSIPYNYVGPGGQVALSNAAGDWWSWTGIKRVIGEVSGGVASQIENNAADADFTIIQQDGDDAEAHARWWAKGNGYVVADVTALMASDPDIGRKIRRAVNTLAAAYLVEHREWYDAGSLTTESQKALAGLESRAEKMLTELFGPKPQGIAGLTPDDTTPDPGELSFVTVERDGEDVDTEDEYSSW